MSIADLLLKVLQEMQEKGLSRCRRSDGEHTVVGYMLLNRDATPLLRLDVFKQKGTK